MRLVVPLVALMFLVPAFAVFVPSAGACDVYVRGNCYHDHTEAGDCVTTSHYDKAEVRVGPYGYNAQVLLYEGCDAGDARDEWVLYRAKFNANIAQKFAYLDHYWHKQDGAVTECRTTLTVYTDHYEYHEFGCPLGPIGPTGLIEDRVPTLPPIRAVDEPALLGALLQASNSGTPVGSTAL